MHIKKLEIYGFKSFCDRTVIHFDQDIVGVVGPNGCGKSNIVDALRWCMGEQSARQLRGRSMEDVIFAGSDNRQPLGFAEVTLTLANDDPERATSLPIEYRDYPEISVSRRLFRDGTSEYLINKTQVRLRDITDLFLGTGVGTRAYSIVEQGKIGMVVSGKPEERRLLIEEAAGITKYKHRKKQAEKKMDLTRQNLLRVGDIVLEIERNLTSLKRQASKAERYLAYRREYDDLVLHEASHRWLEIAAGVRFLEETRDEAQEIAQRKKTELDAREAKLEAARAEGLRLEQETERRQNAAFLADNDVRGCEAETTRALDRFRHLAERRRHSADEMQKADIDVGRLDHERQVAQADLRQLDERETGESEKLSVEESTLAGLDARQRDAEARAAELQNIFATSTACAAAAQERLASFERRVSEMHQQRDRSLADAQRFHEDQGELERSREQALARCSQLDRDHAAASERVEALATEMRVLRESLVARERELETAKSELSQQRGRLRTLEEVHARHEGVGSGARALVETRDPAVSSLAADVVEAPEHLIDAFAGLLGDRLQSVMIADMSRAPDLLGRLAEQRSGRATLIPVSPPYVAASNRSDLVGPGVLGPIIDFLAFAPEHEPVVRLLVSDAVLVESDEVARRCHTLGEHRTVVTLTGNVYWSDGTVSGGAGDAVAAGLLQQKRQLRDARQTVAAKQTEVDKLVGDHAALRVRMSECGEVLDQARAAERGVQIESVTAHNDLRRIEDRLAAIGSRLSEIERALGELDIGLDEAAREHKESERMLLEAQAQASQASEQLDLVQNAVRELAEQATAQSARCTERKIAFATVRQQAAAARQTIDRLTRSIDELSARRSRLENDALEDAKQQGETAASMFALRERMQTFVTAAAEAQTEFDKRRKALDDVRNTLGICEADIKFVRKECESTIDIVRQHELAIQKIALERNHLLERIAEKFRGLHLGKVVGDYHMRRAPDDVHRARIQELANLIERMGPVNLEAMAEYEETSKRYSFYTTQKADLEQALRDLEIAIQQMNRESRRLFRETFDGINERFKEVFPRMFRGGRAHLALTNPDDLLETGVDIVAQPPGKNIGSIDLLSGGEKALTAASLIFAIFLHRPSPFCVLDEVDASLDEANVVRYADMIRSMTDRSQFILITHIKRTMQSVDVLYGVTMQEPGVSRVVSVKVNPGVPQRSQEPVAEAVA